MRDVMRAEIIGRGEPVVLVPGGFTGWISWQPHAEHLSSRYRVVRVQLLSVDAGLRQEPLPPDYSIETESAALTRTLDEAGITEAHLAGWSYGGEALLDFSLDHPERVRTLTLIEPGAFWALRRSGRFDRDAAAMQEQMRRYGPGEVTAAQLVEFMHGAGFVPADVDPRTLSQWPAWMEYRNSLRMGDAEFRHDDDLGRVRAFERPVLLFKGEGSLAYNRAIVDVLGAAFPRSRVEELPGGHALHVVSMPRFLEIYTAFLTASAAA